MDFGASLDGSKISGRHRSSPVRPAPSELPPRLCYPGHQMVDCREINNENHTKV
jgi:hypothetical protein